MPPTFRYVLQPYSLANRHTCPECGHRRKYARYIDTRTGDLLPEHFGKCERRDSCGYYLNPYWPGISGISWARQQYLDARALTGSTPWRPRQMPRPPAVPAQAPQPVVSIPAEVMMATLAHYDRNNLARLLRNHFGAGIADELLARFWVGTSAHWPGACVFWLLDEQSRARGGQVVLYDETGHTVKQLQPDGTMYRHTTWVHTALVTRCRQQGQPTPAWLTDYIAPSVPKSPCLFGLHQLNNAPFKQPVAIVESAKTAIFCSPYLPAYLWLATGSKGQLTPDRLAPVKGRHLVLFPDCRALQSWQERAEQLRKLGFTVTVSTWLERNATPQQLAAGYDLADVLLDQWPGYPPSWDEATAAD